MRRNLGRAPLTRGARAPRLADARMSGSAPMSSSVPGEPIRGPEARHSPEETHAMPTEDAFVELVARVRVEVDARLVPWLERHVALARSRGVDVEIVADAVRSLILSGGKR